jgi:hypothetical protein
MFPQSLEEFAMYRTPKSRTRLVPTGLLIATTLALASGRAEARSNIRLAFFEVYPGGIGTALDTVPSHATHCGVCHYDFSGGGPRNPYGVRLGQVIGGFPNTSAGRRNAVLSIQNEDPDADGYTTLTELTELLQFGNTPTFPGLTPANVGSVTNVELADIEAYLVPVAGVDTTPPEVEVRYPNGGEVVVANGPVTVQWNATDTSGIASVDLFVSEDNGATHRPVALGIANTGSLTWFPGNRPTTQARFRVVATDNALNIGQDDSDAVFTIASPPGGLAPTTLRDFDLPGSQPFDVIALNNPNTCAVCHGHYSPPVEPHHNWSGSMMAHASIDPLFEACMAIANQDAPDSGDLCLRCHIPSAWLRGRSIPTDGSQALESDKFGVACDLCHRMLDPVYEPGVSPAVDEDILAGLQSVPTHFGNGTFVVDPIGTRRGPFDDAASGHAVVVSPFHREAALCGTCHDVSNPAFEKGPGDTYVPNAFDTPPTSMASTVLMPIERTYSEWLNSEYNTPLGVYAPQFGGNRDYVATCQDCHMRDVTGQGCNFGTPPIRTDLPLHDLTGGSAWMLEALAVEFPAQVDADAAAAGAARARSMLQLAADLDVAQQGASLQVTITNQTGHKLPTGYPEGRRMWINVQFFDDNMALVEESAAYDDVTAILTTSGSAKVYEAKPGLDEVTAPLVGGTPGPSFHFVLNNKIHKDNRIPPRGFTNTAFADFGGAPVGHAYADGQYWDDTLYDIPAGATSARVTLYYQSTSREYVEFLRDENTTNTKGQELYDLWIANGMSPPEFMAQQTVIFTPPVPGDCDGDGAVGVADLGTYAGCMAGPDAGPLVEACTCADLDGDGDADLMDFSAMQRAAQ